MTSYTRVRLRPRGPFHFGGRGVGLEHSEVWFPADSLFSALCIAIAQRHGATRVEALLEQFKAAETADAAPFRLTSLMPHAGEVMFLPYPQIGPPNVPGATDLRSRKKFKDIEWVSQAVFNDLARGNTPTQALDSNEPITVQGGTVWVTAGEVSVLKAFAPGGHVESARSKILLWTNWHRPRVTVDRTTSASVIYSVGGTLFHSVGEKEDQTAGLYTMIEWLAADEDTRTMVKLAFEDLGYDGIGGKRSNGYGQFAPAFDHSNGWDIGANQGNYFTTLAPYSPQPQERGVIGPGARYEIALRRGWLSLPGYTNLRRASVRMIAVGSVLRWPLDRAPMGGLVNTTPEKVMAARGPTIYRFGLAFPVRIADAAMPTGAELGQGGAV